MKISLNKFGTNLTSRPAGKEAFEAFKPSLKGIGEDEKIEVDFQGVISFSPSWGDEFLSSLLKMYGDRLVLLNIQGNKSIEATLELLEEINENKFRIAEIEQ